MLILTIVIMIMLYTFQSTFCNMYARFYPGEKKNTSLTYSVFYGIIISFVTFVLTGFSLKPSSITLILGCLNGVTIFLYNMMLIKASTDGPFSVTMIFNLCGGILLPLIVSVFIDGEKLSLLQYIAIGIMLVSFVFLNLEEKKSNKKVSMIFILECIFLGMINGLYGVFLNTQKNLTNSTEDAEMIAVTFTVLFLLSFVIVICRNGKKTFSAFRQNKKSMLSCIVASLSAVFAVKLLMYCLSLMNVAVVSALNNGGILMLSVLWSFVILHEKIGRNKIIGLILASVAVVALGI